MGTEQLQAARVASPAVAATTTDHHLQAAIAAERPDLHAALATNPALYPELREWLALVGWHPAPHLSGAAGPGMEPTASAAPVQGQVIARPDDEPAPSHEQSATVVIGSESAPVASGPEPVAGSSGPTAWGAGPVASGPEPVAGSSGPTVWGAGPVASGPEPVAGSSGPTASAPSPVTSAPVATSSQSAGDDGSVIDYGAATTVLPAGAWAQIVADMDRASSPEVQDPVLNQSAATTVMPAGAWRSVADAQPDVQPGPQPTVGSAPSVQAAAPFQPHGAAPAPPPSYAAYQPQGAAPAPPPDYAAFQPPGAVPFQPQGVGTYQPQAASGSAGSRTRRTWVFVGLGVVLALAVVGVVVVVLL